MYLYQCIILSTFANYIFSFEAPDNSCDVPDNSCDVPDNSCNVPDTSCDVPDTSCDAPDPLFTIIPGSATAWSGVYDRLCDRAEEVKAWLAREGLGKVVGRLAREASLPGTEKQWREKFEEFNRENILPYVEMMPNIISVYINLNLKT